MTTPTEFALAALRRVAERYVAFCYQAGIAADAASLDPTEQLHAQALSALARVRVLDAERRAPSPSPVEAGPSADPGKGMDLCSFCIAQGRPPHTANECPHHNRPAPSPAPPQACPGDCNEGYGPTCDDPKCGTGKRK